jgi:tRNA (guanine-N7-)-methyltransferase
MSERPERRRRSVHGRRKGRPLRPGRQRLMGELLPKLAVDIEALRRNPDALFPRPKRDFWLEIGFGGGEHLAWQAEHNPQVGFLGADIFENGVASLLRHLEERELKNVRVHKGDARDLLEALPDARLGRVFILFPDPWPKLRHHKRRLVTSERLDLLARVMRPGAELRLASDDPGYVTWMLELACAHPAFRWLASRAKDWRERPDDWPPTRYEEKALAAGRTPTYLRFERRERESP